MSDKPGIRRFGITIMLMAVTVFLSTKSYGQNITAGLAAYYTFCDCTPKDMSGNNRHGTMVGSPQCIRGMRDYGLLLNQVPGVNGCGQAGGQYIQLPQLGPIWSDGFTVCAWVRFDELKSYERIIDFGNASGEAGGMPVWFGREGNTNTLTLESWVDANSTQARSTGRLTAPNAITNGSIEYYCATIHSDTMRIYVNGVLKAEKRGNPIANVNRTNNFIGRSNWCFGDPDFKGFMDEVRIYNRALSLQEIQSLYRVTNVKDFTAKRVCSTLQVDFSSETASDIDSLKWDFDDPASSGRNQAWGQAATHLFSDSGTYKVRLVAYKPCLNDTITKEVYLYPLARFLGNDFDLCPGRSVVLKQKLPGATYQWQDGSAPDSFVVTQPGLYWLQVDVGGCAYRDSVLVASARKTSQHTAVICEGQTYLGYGTTGTYQDTFALANGCDSIRTLDLVVQTKTMVSVDKTICDGQTYQGYSTAGIYTDTLRYTTGCDSVIRSLHLFVQKPQVQKTTATICQGRSYPLPWGQVVGFAGTYRDTLHYVSGCDSVIREVRVDVLPVTVISTAASICTGGRYALPWGPVVTTAGMYSDTLHYSNGCDSVIREIRLVVTSPAFEDIAASICEGETYTLPSGVLTSSSGIYRDTLHTPTGCDSVVRTITLDVHQRPQVSVSRSNDVDCMLGSAKLLATGGAAYAWTPAASLDKAAAYNPVASPDSTTTYHVRVTNRYGCSTEDSIEVKVAAGVPGSGYPVLNVFTPNADGRNDRFGVPFWGSVTGFTFSIYNRWGERVFYTNHVAECWDGTWKGNNADTGVYVYMISATTRCGPVVRKGSFLLMR